MGLVLPMSMGEAGLPFALVSWSLNPHSQLFSVILTPKHFFLTLGTSKPNSIPSMEKSHRYTWEWYTIIMFSNRKITDLESLTLIMSLEFWSLNYGLFEFEKFSKQ